MAFFRFEELAGSIGLLTIDVPEKKVNTLSKAVLMELAAQVEQRKANRPQGFAVSQRQTRAVHRRARI